MVVFTYLTASRNTGPAVSFLLLLFSDSNWTRFKGGKISRASAVSLQRYNISNPHNMCSDRCCVKMRFIFPTPEGQENGLLFSVWNGNRRAATSIPAASAGIVLWRLYRLGKSFFFRPFFLIQLPPVTKSNATEVKYPGLVLYSLSFYPVDRHRDTLSLSLFFLCSGGKNRTDMSRRLTYSRRRST